MTTRDLEAEIAAIRAARDAAQRNLIKIEHQRDTAKAQLDHIAAALKTEYGCDSVEQAAQLLNTFEDEFAAAIDKVKKALTEAGA